MVYCAKCGQKNDDAAEFCSQCGAKLHPSQKEYEKEWEDRCERECAGGKDGKGPSLFWGAIVIIIGLWIIFEFVIKNLASFQDLPPVIQNFEFWWVIALIIGLAIISTGIRIIMKR